MKRLNSKTSSPGISYRVAAYLVALIWLAWGVHLMYQYEGEQKKKLLAEETLAGEMNPRKPETEAGSGGSELMFSKDEFWTGFLEQYPLFLHEALLQYAKRDPEALDEFCRARLLQRVRGK